MMSVCGHTAEWFINGVCYFPVRRRWYSIRRTTCGFVLPDGVCPPKPDNWIAPPPVLPPPVAKKISIACCFIDLTKHLDLIVQALRDANDAIVGLAETSLRPGEEEIDPVYKARIAQGARYAALADRIEQALGGKVDPSPYMTQIDEVENG